MSEVLRNGLTEKEMLTEYANESKDKTYFLLENVHGNEIQVNDVLVFQPIDYECYPYCRAIKTKEIKNDHVIVNGFCVGIDEKFILLREDNTKCCGKCLKTEK